MGKFQENGTPENAARRGVRARGPARIGGGRVHDRRAVHERRQVQCARWRVRVRDGGVCRPHVRRSGTAHSTR